MMLSVLLAVGYTGEFSMPLTLEAHRKMGKCDWKADAVSIVILLYEHSQPSSTSICVVILFILYC